MYLNYVGFELTHERKKELYVVRISCEGSLIQFHQHCIVRHVPQISQDTESMNLLLMNLHE
jgi:hypothetical protein